MSSTTSDRNASCWTESHALRHCEGYRVLGPEGPLGYVEEVWTYEDGEVSALVVAGEGRRVVLAVDVAGVDDRAEVLTVQRLGDLTVSRAPVLPA